MAATPVYSKGFALKLSTELVSTCPNQHDLYFARSLTPSDHFLFQLSLSL
eukprot:m.264379 g.264379  ORF g.264379 m.264379 type:complete len:50 (-) comp15612_c0_seq9:1868-2017(-)